MPEALLNEPKEVTPESNLLTGVDSSSPGLFVPPAPTPCHDPLAPSHGQPKWKASAFPTIRTGHFLFPWCAVAQRVGGSEIRKVT